MAHQAKPVAPWTNEILRALQAQAADSRRAILSGLSRARAAVGARADTDRLRQAGAVVTPNTRSLRWLTSRGWLAQTVERYVAAARRRIDLFGCIDLVAIRPGATLGVQVTTATNLAARARKITHEAATGARAWLEAGNQLEIHGWRAPSSRRRTWTLRRVAIVLRFSGRLATIELAVD